MIAMAKEMPKFHLFSLLKGLYHGDFRVFSELSVLHLHPITLLKKEIPTPNTCKETINQVIHHIVL